MPAESSEPFPAYAAIKDTITGIWRHELNSTAFSDDDNFYILGGNSLIMIRMQEEISRELGFDVPIDELFRRQTINEICEYLSTQAPG